MSNQVGAGPGNRRQSIDLLAPKKSLIDLSVPTEGSFDSAIVGYQMCRLMEDVILCKFKDETEDVRRKEVFCYASHNKIESFLSILFS